MYRDVMNRRSCYGTVRYSSSYCRSKVKVGPLHAMKAYSGDRGIAPLILNPGTTWMGGASLLTYFNTDYSNIASKFIVTINVSAFVESWVFI
jgi:hypothetical protein